MTVSERIAREKAERSLSEFIRQGWHAVEPSTEYLHNWHIDAIAEHLQAVTRGQIKKLIINVPPGHMKSLTVCVFWPAWEWGPANLPHLRYIFASYAAHLSTRDSERQKLLMQSDWYRRNWGDRFELQTQLKHQVTNDRTGFRLASSVGGIGTGERVHRAVNDDLLRANDAHSEAMRTQAIEHLRAMSTRGVNPNDFAQVVIMQRLHEADPAGWLLEQGGWEHLCLPAEFEPQRRSVTCIWQDPRNEPGELLWPQQFPAETIADIKKALGSYGASGQLQQRPSPDEGGILKRGWWKFCDAHELPAEFDEIIQSWDMAFKSTTQSDFVVGQVWARAGANRYLLDSVRGRLSFTDSVKAVRMMSARWPGARAKLIEDKANGPAIIDTLKSEIPGIIAVNPEGGKEARAHAVAPTVEAGNVWLPNKKLHPWVDEFIDECASFPKGANDDQVDAFTQALLRWQTKQPPRRIHVPHMAR